MTAPVIRTDETTEAIGATAKALTELRATMTNPNNWKWTIIALHNALQSFLVLALRSTSPTVVARVPQKLRNWDEALRAAQNARTLMKDLDEKLRARFLAYVTERVQDTFTPAELRGYLNFIEAQPIDLWSLDYELIPLVTLFARIRHTQYVPYTPNHDKFPYAATEAQHFCYHRTMSSTRTLLRPPHLQPGDTIGVIAPSLPVMDTQRDRFARGEQVLHQLGFRTKLGATVGQSRWWSAGTPAELAADINAMFADPEVRAIIAHTGGFSAMGVLDRLDYPLISRHPKPFLGMSDITIYHLTLFARCGLVGFHADDLTEGFGTFLWDLDEAKRDALLAYYKRLLTEPEAAGTLAPLTAWETWRDGRASGPLVGGSLKRLAALAGTPYFPPLAAFDGALLFWEEIGETLYDITLNLHKLRHLGIFDRIAGMLVGKLVWVNEYFKALEHPSPREAVLDVVGDYDFPILADMDFGHRTANIPLPIGVRAEMDAGQGRYALVEAAVS
jgi:muramoyltetrapeptide carboxypeptidase